MLSWHGLFGRILMHQVVRIWLYGCRLKMLNGWLSNFWPLKCIDQVVCCVVESAMVLCCCKSVARGFECGHDELLQIPVTGGLTRNSYYAGTSLIIECLVNLVLLCQDAQCSFSINESLKVGLILSTVFMVEMLVVLWVGKARLVCVGHVCGGVWA